MPPAFADLLGLPAAVIREIVAEKRALSAEVAERIQRQFGGEVAFWLLLQQSYDDKIALLAPGQAWPWPAPAAS